MPSTAAKTENELLRQQEQFIIRQFTLTIISIIVALIVYYISIASIISLLCFVLTAFLGIYCGFKVTFLSSKPYRAELKHHEPSKYIMNLIKERNKLEEKSSKMQPVFTKNIDDVITEIMDLTIRDCILYWYQELVSDPQSLPPVLKNEIWLVMESIKSRLENLDEVEFLIKNITNRVCKHFNKLHLVLAGNFKTFELNSYLSDETKELKYLQNLSEFLLVILLPNNYEKCLPVRHLLREILTRSALYPCINMLCDPDYINQKLLTYLDHQARMLEQHNRTYAYAASYEDFIQMIYKCTTVEDLKQMRYKIMTEIMHSTTINNLKKAKGMDADKQFKSQGTGKADLLEARHLPRYINQLTFGKSLCEKRIKGLGGPDYSSPMDALSSEDVQRSQNIPGKKVLSLPVILDNPHAKHYLMLFLKQKDSQALLQFWCDINEMKDAARSKRHSLGNEIFRNHINNQNSIIRLSKSIVKGMEAFLIADKGPDSFFEAQEEVYTQIEQKWYPAFIVSDIYHKMITGAQDSGIDFLKRHKSISIVDSVDGPSQVSPNQILFSDHSSYAKSKLYQISDKLMDKISALQAVSMNLRADQKITNKLELEIGSLKQEEENLSLHIDRTEIWSENLGGWAANIHTVQEILEDEKLVPYFVILVHLKFEEVIISTEDKKPDKWMISRKIQDFHALYAKLLPAAAWLKTFSLPSENKWFKAFGSGSQLEKSRIRLQAFLSRIMEDDQLNKSEALYTFLSPSPEYLKTVSLSGQKSRFSLANIFKSNNTSDNADNSEEDEYLFFDEYDIKEDKKDSIAEPLYSLIGEIFELHGVFKWLRKTLIIFVQVSFGRTINKQLRETISWIFSETMIVYYLNTFKDSMWPDGEMAPAWPPRTDQEKQETRLQAKTQCLNSIPGFLVNLVGQQNARQGVVKVFEALQDKQLNKQLLYSIMEDFIIEFAPELK